MGPPPVAVPQTSVFYANDDTVIGQSNEIQKRYNVSLNEISPYVKEATLSIEDQRFYKHHGFDVKRIAGAIVADLKAMAKVQGASTITQQYARNLYLDHDKTWKRKLLEAMYTIRLEVNYNKNHILEGYLNTIYYGHGAYGIEAASRLYFDKTAKELSDYSHKDIPWIGTKEREIIDYDAVFYRNELTSVREYDDEQD